VIVIDDDEEEVEQRDDEAEERQQEVGVDVEGTSIVSAFFSSETEEHFLCLSRTLLLISIRGTRRS